MKKPSTKVQIPGELTQADLAKVVGGGAIGSSLQNKRRRRGVTTITTTFVSTT